MGEVISAIAEGVKNVVDDIAKLVTDVESTVSAIEKGINTFGAITSAQQAVLIARNPSIRSAMVDIGPGVYTLAAGDDQLQAAIRDYMSAAQNAAEETFNTQFPKVELAGSDSGVVKGFQVGGQNLSTLLSQIDSDFSNWQINCSGDTQKKMAKTIQVQVDAKGGATSTSFGRVSINTNATIHWTAAYGVFPVTTTSMGLIYGFCAGMKIGGW